MQNETIRINIDINDSAIRDLNSALSDLQRTFNELNGSLRNVVGNVQGTVRELGFLERVGGASVSVFNTLERSLRFFRS